MSHSVLDITVGGTSPDTATEASISAEARALDAELAEFLRDPIGFGQYDWSDPIALDEFVTAKHHHERYLEPLVR